MPPDRERRAVVVPRPGAHATAPPEPARNVHPVQPAHASTARPIAQQGHDASSSSSHAAPIARVTTSHHPETVGHAVDRMLSQGYSPGQVEGQIRRWHPDWPSSQIKSEVHAVNNPTAHAPKTHAIPKTASVALAPRHAAGNCTPLVQRQIRRHHAGGFLGGIIEGATGAIHAGEHAAGWAGQESARGARAVGRAARSGYGWTLKAERAEHRFIRTRTVGDYLKIIGGSAVIAVGTVSGGSVVLLGAGEVGIGGASEPESGPAGLIAIGFGFETIGVGASLVGASFVAGGGLIKEGVRRHDGRDRPRSPHDHQRTSSDRG